MTRLEAGNSCDNTTKVAQRNNANPNLGLTQTHFAKFKTRAKIKRANDDISSLSSLPSTSFQILSSSTRCRIFTVLIFSALYRISSTSLNARPYLNWKYTVYGGQHVNNFGSNLSRRQTLPPFLTENDFRNAKYVNTNKPLKAIMNDQRFSKASKKSKRARRGSVVAVETDKWPNGRIPYVLSAAYTATQRAVLARAIASYNSKTCIRFVPKVAADRDYVVISKLDGCYADFARVGGRQQVSLADECIDYATIIHEFMHVIGFIHEHQREDREQFVKIVWANVIEGANADFDKLSAVGLSNYGETYDYFSIMHYESTEGSRNGKNTIEAKIGEYTPLMGKSTDFTTGDLNRVNRAYNCNTQLLRRN